MNSALIEPGDPRWSGLLERTPHDTYHRAGYTTLCARLERGTARALWVGDDEGELLIPLVVRQLPRLGDPSLEGWSDAVSPYGYPAVLARGAWTSRVEALRDQLVDALACERILAAFIRGNPMRPAADALLESLGVGVVAGDTVVVDLARNAEDI